MGYSTIIAAAIIMLTGSATILTTGLTSMETIPSTITKQVQSAEEKLGEACSLGKIVEVDSYVGRYDTLDLPQPPRETPEHPTNTRDLHNGVILGL